MNPLALFDLASDVLNCVCSELDSLTEQMAELGVPNFACPCSAFVSYGPPVVDCCGECDGSPGQLTVHVERLFPSDNFPNPSPNFFPCKAATHVAQVVVTVSRCVPVMDDQGNPPAIADVEAASKVVYADMLAAQTALQCCVPASVIPPGKTKGRAQVVDASNTADPQGGCETIAIRAFVDAGQICGCSNQSS